MKRIFPAVWLGSILLAVGGAISTSIVHHKNIELAFAIGPIAMVVLGFLLFRRLLWDLADEVKDGGSFLLVRKGSIEDRVQLSNVMNVSMNYFINPKRLNLRLRTPGKFGDEIVFIPKMSPFQFKPFARYAIVESLIQRVDRARQQG